MRQFSRVLGVLTVLVLVASHGAALENGVGTSREMQPVEGTSEGCSEFEVFWSCGSECPETCATLGQPRACGLRCKSGCFCREGLVRDEQGHCVRPFECSNHNHV